MNNQNQIHSLQNNSLPSQPTILPSTQEICAPECLQTYINPPIFDTSFSLKNENTISTPIENKKRKLPKKTISPGYHEAETTITLTWDALFSYFCLNNNLNLSKLNTIAGIIYKLSAAHCQFSSLQLKSKELSIKEYNHKSKHALLPKKSPKSLSPEILLQIEQQLQLL